MALTPPPLPQYWNAPHSPRRTNIAAVCSLIFVCASIIPIPFLASIAAMTLGIFGLRKSRNPQFGGRGLAIAGLVLGAIIFLMWTAFAAYAIDGFFVYQRATAVAAQFVSDLGKGNISAASAKATGLSMAEIKKASDELRSTGSLRSVDDQNFQWNFAAELSSHTGSSSESAIHVEELATFDHGKKTCTLQLIKQNGAYRVSACSVH